MPLREFKIVVLGSGGVGKSALTVQFVQGIFVEKYDPTIEDSYRKQVEVDSNQCMLEILDTAGTEQFTAMRDLYMKNGQGFVLVYSIISNSTFNELPDLREQILRVKDCEDVPMVLVGNKCDLHDQRVISTEQGEELARKFGDCYFLEASAKNKVNVEQIFYNLIRQINRKNPVGPPSKAKSKCALLMLSRATRLLSTKNVVVNSIVKHTTIRSFASHGGGEAGGAYPTEPEAGTQMITRRVEFGDAVYSYKHGNFIVDPIQIRELAEEQQQQQHHVHGPGCSHGHHHDSHANDGHHDEHHDEHHDHVNPDDVEDEFPRGYFLNTPPSVPYPMNPYYLTALCLLPIIGSLFSIRYFDNKSENDYELFRSEYLEANPALKQKYYDITHKYPLSH